MSKNTNDGRLSLVWHRMLYSCTHTATVGVKGLNSGVVSSITQAEQNSFEQKTDNN